MVCVYELNVKNLYSCFDVEYVYVLIKILNFVLSF